VRLSDWAWRTLPSLYRAPILGSLLTRRYYSSRFGQASAPHWQNHWRNVLTPEVALPKLANNATNAANRAQNKGDRPSEGSAHSKERF
jgi:hypothetical protein